jgi:hypothetical protein
MQVLGLRVYTPLDAASDLAALERLVRTAPRQFERALTLAEEMVDIGRRVLVIAERLDRRAVTINELGERLDERAAELLGVGAEMRELGGRIDLRGAEIVERASLVVESAGELIGMLPTLERALELATPLEGAIDRFGRLVDRFPGAGSSTRRRPAAED